MAYESNLESCKPSAAKKKPRSARQRRASVTPRGGGRLSKVEKSIIAHLVQDTPGEVSRDQVQSTALMLRRNPRTVAQAIAEAREKLQEHASRYVEIHLEAAERALASGDHDVARKAAAWAMERISSRDESGKVERVIEPASQSERDVPRIQIGIALGGMPRSSE